MRFPGSLLFVLVCQSVVVTTTASIAPVFDFPSCSICPSKDESPTNGERVLPINTAGILIEEATCDQVQANAIDGDYSPFACTILQQQIAADCGCATTGVVPSAPVPTAPVPTAPVPTAPVPTAPVPTAPVPTAPVPTAPVPTAPVPTSTATPEAPTTMMPTMAPVTTTTPPPTEMPVMVMPSGMTIPTPVAAPTSAPMAATTAAPTVAPAMVPTTMAPTTMAPTTMVPTMTPTMTPTMVPGNETAVSVNATVYVTLNTVPLADISEDEKASLVAAVQGYLAGKFACVTDLVVSLTSQQPLTDGTVEFGSYLGFQVTGSTDALDNESFEEDLVDIFSSEEFLGVVNGTPGFEGVTTIVVNETAAPTVAPATAGGSATTVAPTASPVEVDGSTPSSAPNGGEESQNPESDDDDGLSGGAIAGIIVAVALGVCCIGGGLYYASKGSSDVVAAAPVVAAAAAKPRPPYEPISEVVKTDMMYPPAAFQATKIDKPPVASAAAVAAAASGSFMGDPSIIKTGSQIGAEAGSSDASTAAGDTAASGAMSSLKQSMLCREVDAPPGKLGIVIDTTLEGPVVHKISSESPLEGIIFPGDIIVAINDVDTRAMSASAITALMARTSTSRRVLTVLSEDVSN